jgi:pyrroloquinoline quinone (PQQ) biosynthesis protein C
MSQLLTFPTPANQLAKPAEVKTRSFSPHPPWIVRLINDIAPYQERIFNCPLVKETAKGSLSLEQMRGWLMQLYPFIETFPQWIALNIAKAENAMAREILIDNVRVEKWHAKQWMDMTDAFGISREELQGCAILPEVEALTHYMWSINLRGTLAESMSAMTYAIEGTTQGIAQAVLQGFPKYDGRDGIHLTKRAYAWMKNHARYDEAHPLEALEIIIQSTDTEHLKDRVTQAAKRSMEYFHIALDACYRNFNPVDVSVSHRSAHAA